MSSLMAKGVPLKTLTLSGHKSTGNAFAPVPKIDFSIFKAKEIRDILKSKAHCLQAGFSSNHLIIKTMNEIRDHYVATVGLATYLSQMLGELAQTPIQFCVLYDEAGRPLKLDFQGDPDQPVQRFIAKKFRSNNLPFMVAIRRNLDSERVEIRYL